MSILNALITFLSQLIGIFIGFFIAIAQFCIDVLHWLGSLVG